MLFLSMVKRGVGQGQNGFWPQKDPASGHSGQKTHMRFRMKQVGIRQIRYAISVREKLHGTRPTPAGSACR